MATSSSFTGHNAFEEMASVLSASTLKVPCHVFINHRGEDVKHTFATAIYNNLASMGLHVCLDVYWLKAGDEIPSELEAAMSSASVHIAIFSENYAESPWCLDELSFMLKTGTKIIPVFYGVKPSDLRHVDQGKGKYVNAFVKHEQKGRYSFAKLVEWKTALRNISFIKGHLVNNISCTEGELVKTIVNDVRRMIGSLSRVPYHNTEAVGIDHKVTEVIELLEWNDDKPAVAVVIYGIGGAGKTTLADEVYATLNLQGWKHSKITLIKNMETHQIQIQIQIQILQDLTGIKPSQIRDFRSGQDHLKSVIESEEVFIYMDNVLKREHLENLLPKHIACPKKVRILATARTTNVLGVFESCGIKPCKLYSIESLSFQAAMEVLCKKIDREREIKSIVDERPEANVIAKECSCCPLFLEVVGAYLHKRNNEVEAYERVFGWLRDGEPFSCDKEYRFDESTILFSYHQLESRAQDAFLDICSFFYDWEWKEVAWIVGSEELQCLLDGALVKKIEVEDYRLNGKVERINIHDLLLTAGRNISKGNRFKSRDEFSNAMTDEVDLLQIKGVWLRDNRVAPFHVSADVLDVMSGSLRVFSMGDNTIVSGQCSKQFNKLRVLQAHKLPNLAIDRSKLKHLTFMDYGFRKDEIWSPPKNMSSLQVLKLDKSWRARGNMDATIDFRHLDKLRYLALSNFHIDEISSFVKLISLQTLKLYRIQGLKELSGRFRKLRLLQELYLKYCRELKQLPAAFGELSALTRLDLEGCRNLQELPCDLEKLSELESLTLVNCSSLLVLPEGIGKLQSLTYIDVHGCTQLSSLPSRVAELSVLKGRISFEQCSGLKELTEHICKLSLLTSLNMLGCKSLSRLPQGFGKLRCLKWLELSGCDKLEELTGDFDSLGALKYLGLSSCKSLSKLPDCVSKLCGLENLVLTGCDKIEELCSDFGSLGSLKDLQLSGCNNLSKLPNSFGKLFSLKRLVLSRCRKIEELCSDFGSLGALKNLQLSGCNSLCKLPHGFGQLGCLEMLDLSMCSKLEELSSDFHCLSSLIKLDLSNCESLGGKWLDRVGAIQSLWRLDIAGSEKMIQRWIELQREKEEWHFMVVTDFSLESTAEGNSDLLLRGMLSKMFDESELLIDIHQCPFYSSSILPNTTIILIFHPYGEIDGEVLLKYMLPLESDAKALSIIYVGSDFNSLPLEVRDRILAYTPNSRCSLFFDKFRASFPSIRFRSMKVYRSSDGFEEKGIKCPTKWEDISYTFNEVAFLLRTPQESNVEILSALLQTDFLLLNNSKQVKLTELQGKVILLLSSYFTMSDIRYLAFKDLYMKMLHAHRDRVEVVWIPLVPEWDELNRVIVDAPWPVVPNPSLSQKKAVNLSFLEAPATTLSSERVVVVDGKGRISNKDALPMIERWGVEAFPFSQTREKELRKSEWEKASNYNQFVFQNLDFNQTKGMEASPCGEMMLLCVGNQDKMLEFAAEWDHGLAKLKCHFQVLYVGWGRIYYPGVDEPEIKKISSIHSISLSEAYSFWQRIQYLYNDLTRMGGEEKIVQVRKMVFEVASAEVESRRKKEIRAIVVDKNGEMVSGRGKEVIEALWHYGENDLKSPNELKMERVRQILQGQWKDRKIHPKHHPQHLLLQMDYRYARPYCCKCGGRELDYYHQCSACEHYVLCGDCIYASF